MTFLTDAHVKFTLADGKTEERTATAGSVRYRPAVKHAVENLHEKDIEVIEVELKGKPVAIQPGIPSALDPAKVDPKHCKVEFENDQVRVLRWNSGPHEKIPMHGHPAYVTVFLTDIHDKFTLPDGKTRESHHKAGETSWSAAQRHSTEGLSDKPTEEIQVELKGEVAAKPAAKAPAKKKTI